MLYLFTMVSWQRPGRHLILASQSPRRQQIMSQMGLTFSLESPDVGDEQDYITPENLESSLRMLAIEKARSVSVKNPDALVLGADTIVVQEKHILGKPKSIDEARRMLRKLSGTQHTVLTAVALLCGKLSFCDSRVAETRVFFRALSHTEIEEYIAIGEYSDKAGAYAIQGRAMIFVDKIEGCFYNVVGLPVTATIDLFQSYRVRKDSADVREK